MPSGAKKRKAAKRKKEQGIIHPPDSPTNPLPPILQGNGHDDGESGDAGSPTTSRDDDHPLTEEEAKDKEAGVSAFGAMDVSESNGGRGVEEPVLTVQKVEEIAGAVGEAKDEGVAVEVEVPISPLPLSEVPEDVGVEILRSEKGGESCETEGAVEGSAEESVDLIERVVTVTEEVPQSIEATPEIPDASVEVDASSGQIEANTVPLPDINTEPSPDALRQEIAPKTEAICAPLAERRASLCDCCGLFGVFMGTQR